MKYFGFMYDVLRTDGLKRLLNLLPPSATQVKDEVLYPWAHCDFTVWTDDMYNKLTIKIKDLIESLGLHNKTKTLFFLQRFNRKGYLTDITSMNSKRWLVTGDVLNSVLAPTLRTYVSERLNQIYGDLMQKSNIDTQRYPHHLTSYLTTYLNYEAINMNRKQGLREQSQWNYKVKNAVDLSKLFLNTHWVHYMAFDDSCDVFLLLEIIIGTCQELYGIQECAKEVKEEVRNPWVHCDFTVWDDNKYKTCMMLIMDLIRSLGLHNQEELTTMFKKWNLNGDKYIDGTSSEFIDNIPAELN